MASDIRYPHDVTPDTGDVREPVNVRTPAELSAILFGKRPPGDAPDPRTGGRWRTAS